MKRKAQNGAERFHQLGFGKAGHADQKAVTARQNGDQRLLHHIFLTEDDPGDIDLGIADAADGTFCLLGDGGEIFFAWAGGRNNAHGSPFPQSAFRLPVRPSGKLRP